jgi:hypothetical protein
MKNKIISYKIINVIFFLIGLIFSSSCKKENMCDCLKSTGDIITEVRSVSDFTTIEVYKNVNVILTQDVVNSLSVEAGEHLMSNIKTEVNSGVLTISNDNVCNWVRSYEKKINVSVHVKNLGVIRHYGSETISSANEITTDGIDLNLWSSGIIDMKLNTAQSFTHQHVGAGDIKLSGYSRYSYTYNASGGFQYLQNMNSDTCIVDQRGPGDVKVNVNRKLSVSISGVGNVFYSGNPLQVESNISGSGKLIHE